MFKPLNERVLVKRYALNNVSPGGIIIPDAAMEKSTFGTVVAIGTGRRNAMGDTIPLEVRVGDKVLVSQHAGFDIKLDGDTYLLIREDDVFGIVERDEQPAPQTN